MTIRKPFDRVFMLPLVFVAIGLRWLPNIWFVVIPYHAMCLALPFVEVREKRFEALRLTKSNLRGPIVIAIITIALGVVLADWNILSLLPPSLTSFVTRLHPLSAFFIYSLVVNPFAEEWFWRGFAVDRWGIAESAVWFALLHLLALASLVPLILSALLVLPVFAAAIYWGNLSRRTGSLWPCVFTHLAVDVAILLAISGTLTE